jgi:hypothetical protein
LPAAGLELSRIDLAKTEHITFIAGFGPGRFVLVDAGVGTEAYPAHIWLLDASSGTLRQVGPPLLKFFVDGATGGVLYGRREDGVRLAIGANGDFTLLPDGDGHCAVPVSLSPAGAATACGDDKSGSVSFAVSTAHKLDFLPWDRIPGSVSEAVADDGTIADVLPKSASPRFSRPGLGDGGPVMKAAVIAVLKGPDGRLRLAAIALTPDGNAARALVADAASGSMLFEAPIGSIAGGLIAVAPTGRIAFNAETLLVIEPQGVGYKVLARLPGAGESFPVWDSSGSWLLLRKPIDETALLLHVN